MKLFAMKLWMRVLQWRIDRLKQKISADCELVRTNSEVIAARIAAIEEEPVTHEQQSRLRAARYEWHRLHADAARKNKPIRARIEALSASHRNCASTVKRLKRLHMWEGIFHG